MTVPDERYLAVFDAGVAALAAVPADRFGEPVPACPGWTMSDLFEHVGGVYRWAANVVTTRPATRLVRDRSALPAGADRAAYVAEGAAALRAGLLAADLDEPAWTFAGTRTTRWWLRRQAHETTVHAGDAAEALGIPFDADAAVAVDGIDELLDEFLSRVDFSTVGTAGETVHLHAADADGEWLLRFTGEGVEVTREHAKGDAAVRGPAGDLLRLVWGRVPGPRLDVFGDASILDRYCAAARY